MSSAPTACIRSCAPPCSDRRRRASPGGSPIAPPFPAALLAGAKIDDCTKWWGPDRHIVIYYVTPQRDELYFVTSQPEPEWRNESWSAKGDLGQLRRAFEGFHPQVQAVLNACPDVHKWALYERDPLPAWCVGRVVLLGDACHPMLPYMAQGAANALEDAAVLARCIEGARATGSKAPSRATKPRARSAPPASSSLRGATSG